MFFKVEVFQGPGFSGSRFFKVQVLQGPGFSRSKFFRVQVFQGSGFQSPGPGSRIRVQVLEVARFKLIILIHQVFFIFIDLVEILLRTNLPTRRYVKYFKSFIFVIMLG